MGILETEKSVSLVPVLSEDPAQHTWVDASFGASQKSTRLCRVPHAA